MNLSVLDKWCADMADEDKLEGLVRKVHTNPRDLKSPIIPSLNDVRVAISLLKEIRVRIKLITEHQEKQKNYEANCLEYLAELEKRQVVFPGMDELIEPSPSLTASNVEKVSKADIKVGEDLKDIRLSIKTTQKDPNNPDGMAVGSNIPAPETSQDKEQKEEPEDDGPVTNKFLKPKSSSKT